MTQQQHDFKQRPYMEESEWYTCTRCKRNTRSPYEVHASGEKCPVEKED